MGNRSGFAEQVMTMDEYFEFLEQYWALFGEPEPRPAPKVYRKALL